MLGYFLKQRIKPFLAVYLGFEFLLRIALFIDRYSDIKISAIEYAKVFIVGALFDISAFLFMLVPYAIYLLLLPSKAHTGKIDRIISFGFFVFMVGFISFLSVGEWLFWQEFHNRYNFIAVDYIVYSHEVIGNIMESYNIPLIFSGIIAFSLIISFLLKPCFDLFNWRNDNVPEKYLRPNYNFSKRLKAFVIYIFVLIGNFYIADQEYSAVTKNNYANEIAKNGLFSLFSAFRNNELPFDDFFVTHVDGKEIKPMTEAEMIRFVDNSQRKDSLGKKNVVIIVMESMSASFMKRFGDTQNITPNLDRLVHESIFFEKMHATGTRTVRGLEAIALSIPPSPGRSIVKRPGNEGLFSLGYIFKDNGYDTKFLYGGYGYFDNMNYFFENNGFEAIDRTSFPSEDITFGNIWGVCDQDLYKQIIRQANKSHKEGKPFMHVVMNTSNHRPYTFPKGIPGVPEKAGLRKYGVKYADYAIGEFFEKAKKEPWFDDTIFVIVADHAANSAGKLALTPAKHHIPMFIYAPKLIKPKIIKDIACQIDLGPTILGLLGISYNSKFFGRDLLQEDGRDKVAFIANYQNLGYLTSVDDVTILQVGKKIISYHKEKKTAPNNAKVAKAIKNYRTASRWKDNYKRLK